MTIYCYDALQISVPGLCLLYSGSPITHISCYIQDWPIQQDNKKFAGINSMHFDVFITHYVMNAKKSYRFSSAQILIWAT